MTKSVDWLDVYTTAGPEAVVRGMFTLAVPAVVLPDPKAKTGKENPPPSPLVGGPLGGGVQSTHDLASVPDEAVDLISWGGGVASKDDAQARGVLIRKDDAVPPYLARKAITRLYMPPPPHTPGVDQTFRIARYGGNWWQRPASSSSLPRWKPVDDPDQLEAGMVEEMSRWWVEAPSEKNRHKIKPLLSSSARTLVENALRSMVNYTYVPGERTMPCWLPASISEDGRPTWRPASSVEDVSEDDCSPYRTLDGRPLPANRVIALRNGLLDEEAWCDESRPVRERLRLLPMTPRYFNRSVLPYNLDLDGFAAALEEGEVEAYWRAKAPSFMRYIGDASQGESEWEDLAQEIAGDLMSADRSMHVVHWLQGPPGTGKNTYFEGVVEGVVGPDNWAKCNAQTLTNRFAMPALMGRLAYVVDELRIDRSVSVSALLDMILSVSGGGRVSVEEKFKSTSTHVSVRLPGRFIIACNEDPNWRDASGALMRRLVVLPFRPLPVGRKPDHDLWNKLKREAPTIFTWALMGLLRLRQRGEFTKHPAGVELVSQIRRRMSPVRAFAEDACVVGPGNEVETSIIRELFYAYQAAEGDTRAEDMYTSQRFGAELCAAVPGVVREDAVRRNGLSLYHQGHPYRVYKGIRPRLDHETAETAQNAMSILRWNQGVSMPTKPQTGSAPLYT